MKYLLKQLTPKQERRAARGKFAKVAHLWDGTDTLCRMWTTGGIVRENRYRVAETPEGRPICQLCLGVQGERDFQQAMDCDTTPTGRRPSSAAGGSDGEP